MLGRRLHIFAVVVFGWVSMADGYMIGRQCDAWSARWGGRHDVVRGRCWGEGEDGGLNYMGRCMSEDGERERKDWVGEGLRKAWNARIVSVRTWTAECSNGRCVWRWSGGSCDGAWCVQVYEVSQPLFLFLFILNKDSLLILIKFLLLRMLLSVANNISSQGPWRRFYSSYPRTSYILIIRQEWAFWEFVVPLF